MVFYHEERDIAMAVHGDDFTLCGLEEDLLWIKDLMKTWFEIKVRAILGPEEKDDKEVVILGRKVIWGRDNITYEADEKHREKILEYFGMGKGTRALSTNGEKERKGEDREDCGDEDLEKAEATEFRGLAARLNFMSQDGPDLQFPIKPSSREEREDRGNS